MLMPHSAGGNKNCSDKQAEAKRTTNSRRSAGYRAITFGRGDTGGGTQPESQVRINA